MLRADGVTADMPPLLNGHALSCHVLFPVGPDNAAVVSVHPQRVATVPSVLDIDFRQLRPRYAFEQAINYIVLY